MWKVWTWAEVSRRGRGMSVEELLLRNISRQSTLSLHLSPIRRWHPPPCPSCPFPESLPPPLVQMNTALAVAKRAYNKARGVFYADPAEPANKLRMQQKEGELAEVRGEEGRWGGGREPRCMHEGGRIRRGVKQDWGIYRSNCLLLGGTHHRRRQEAMFRWPRCCSPCPHFNLRGHQTWAGPRPSEPH